MQFISVRVGQQLGYVHVCCQVVNVETGDTFYFLLCFYSFMSEAAISIRLCCLSSSTLRSHDDIFCLLPHPKNSNNT